jgi:hypothetical protein
MRKFCEERTRWVLKSLSLSTACWRSGIPSNNNQDSESWFGLQVPFFNFGVFMSQLFAKDALVVPFEQLRMSDVESVGGKNASLGEMISQLPNGVRVPTGFATTAHAFRAFLKHDGLVDRINQKLDALDVEDVRTLALVGAEIRGMVEAQPFPGDLEKAIRDHFNRI